MGDILVAVLMRGVGDICVAVSRGEGMGDIWVAVLRGW